MDIKQEREAFEKWYCDNHPEHGANPCNDKLLRAEIVAKWEVWQAAKAQAVSEGFVLFQNKVAEKIELIIRDVAELPDRTSPEDWPEALIVTSVELEEILTQHLSEKCRN